MDIGLIKSGLRAATARQIRSVTHRFKFDWSGLGRLGWPLSRAASITGSTQEWDGRSPFQPA